MQLYWFLWMFGTFFCITLYLMDLSNEVINIDFGQGAAKISEVKVGVWKKYLPTRLTPVTRVWAGLIGRYFFWPPTLTSDIFAAPQPKSMFSTSIERSTLCIFGGCSSRLHKRWYRLKLEFEKNICRSAWFEPVLPGLAESADILF